MSQHTSWKIPIRSGAFARQLEQIRRERGVSQDVVAERMGADRAVWSRVAGGRRTGQHGVAIRPSFDTIAAMADALGMALHLVPVGGKVPREVQPMDVDPVIVRPRVNGPAEASPVSARIMAGLREARRAMRLNQETIVERSGMTEHKIAALENGRREPMLCEVINYAEGLGMSVAVVPEASADLAGLSGAEAEEMRRLVLSYVRHRIGRGEPVSTALLTAAGKLDNAAHRAA